MKNAQKKAQKLGVDAVAQARGGIKVNSSIKAGIKTGGAPVQIKF